MRIQYEELHEVLHRALVGTGLAGDRARLCARLIADSSRDGVASHGLNLFPRLMKMIRAGVVDVHARAEQTAAAGAIERWNGKRGVGALNAYECMEAAIALARWRRPHQLAFEQHQRAARTRQRAAACGARGRPDPHPVPCDRSRWRTP